MSENLRKTIHNVTSLSLVMADEFRLFGDKLLTLQLLLDRLSGGSPSSGITRLQRRLDQVRQLRNSMELETLLRLEISREMEETWQRLS